MARKITHGVRSSYTYHKCRCEPCKAANNVYELDRRHIRQPLKPAPHIREMSDTETAWLAGLIEGEGSFTLYQGEGRTRVLISIQMTDKDVLDKVANIVGLGNVVWCTKRKEHHKDTYKWAISSRFAVTELMVVLYPYMGNRRQARITECLTAIRSVW